MQPGMDFADYAKYRLSYDEIQWLLESNSCSKKLIILDACHSGEADLNSGEGTSSASFDLMQEMYINLNGANGAPLLLQRCLATEVLMTGRP